MATYLVTWRTRSGRRRRIRLYYAWQNLRNRVAGRVGDGLGIKRWKGLTVGWATFTEFREWAITHGYQIGLVLDRKESTLGYTADNCQWITSEQNAKKAGLMHKKKCKCFWCKSKRR